MSLRNLVLGVLGSGVICLAGYGVDLPFCTAASNQGAQWWDWTNTTVDAACANAQARLQGAGYSVDYVTSGTYQSDGNNSLRMGCNQGEQFLSGFGAQVFTQGQSLKSSLGWSGCFLENQ